VQHLLKLLESLNL